MDTTTPKRRKRLVIGIVAGVAALALASAGTAYGISAANASAYDDAVARHAELLDEAALAEAQLPLAQHGYVAAWRLATADKNSAASQVALVAAADDRVVSKEAKADLAPLADALEALTADDAAAPTEDDLAANEAVQELLDAEDTDAAAFAPTEATGQFALSDEGADTGAEARAEVDAAVSAAQEQLDELTAQLEDVEARHDAVDAVLLSAAPQLLAAAESAVELAPAWKTDRTKADAKAFDEVLKRLQAAVDGKTEAKADKAKVLFEAPHTVEPDAEALPAAQELLAALSGYVAQANALQQAHADAVAAEEAAAAAAAAAEAAAQQPSYDGGGWTGDSGWNGGGGGWSGGGSGGNSGGGGGGGGGFIDYGTGGGGGGGTTPPPGTCYRADTSGPEICY